MPDIDKNIYSDRRVFFSSNRERYYQIFHFTQSKDGSIYVSWPDNKNTSWLFPVFDTDGNPKIGKIDFENDGKLSIHGTGMGTFRSHEDPSIRPAIIIGNKLLDLGHGEIGTRHLFTAFMKEPVFLPFSPALKRQSDYLINNAEKTEPFVIIFFAIPKMEKVLELNFQISFDIDDVDFPPRVGHGVIGLKYHDVFWCVYRTHNMGKWPPKHQVAFYDGFFVPVLIGAGFGEMRFELRNPKYLLVKNQLTVNL